MWSKVKKNYNLINIYLIVNCKYYFYSIARLKEKTHDIDMMKLQLDQASEFKSKIMESHSLLKKELEKVKMEKQDALEGKDEYNEMAETLEMATLDKEMAEVKAETLQLELEQAKERIEELTVDLELLKAEFEKGGGSEESDGANSFKVKQLEQQNLRLRDTLVKYYSIILFHFVPIKHLFIHLL